ncbi:MAG: hypothetical protein ABI859_03585 [Pseudomonadota bacterium]
MSLNPEDQADRAQDELQVLADVIDYTDRMIFEEGRRIEYGPLRRHAYGKTVVLETEHEGVLTFRLSSTPVVYPNFASGYATPHSSVGRLCAILQPGDARESPRWGNFRVREIRLFDRFDGVQFEPNVRNFLRMAVQGAAGNATVENLRAFLARASPPLVPSPPVATHVPLSLPTASVPAVSVLAPEIAVDYIRVIETEDEGDLVLSDMEVPYDQDVVAPSTDGQIGLNEIFYVNRTREQDAVVSRSPIGPMFVEGVAGSGKTAAALARMKLLVDFRADSVTAREEFEEIAGKELQHWSGSFVGKFTQEGSVGFVRTGELVQYLKETCRRLDLPNLPIKEYPELRSDLRQARRVDLARPGAPQWKGLPEARGTNADTTIRWLRAADCAVARRFAKTLTDGVPLLADLVSLFSSKSQAQVERVGRAALEALRPEIGAIVRELARAQSGAGFALDRLASRLNGAIERVRSQVLGRSVLWASIGDQS